MSSRQPTTGVAVVIPNWNGKEDLPACLDSLRTQSELCEIIVVENGSTDGSLELVKSLYPEVTLLPQKKNLGFDGGVNVGIRYALDKNYPYIALLNNDAVADKDWLRHLVMALENNPQAGIATCKFMDSAKQHLDSTGDIYTTWGLSYPRGRGEPVSEKYDGDTLVFGASGGASLYRAALLRQIGLFDEDFFAYYEDVDISWRAQLTGWKVAYEPKAIAYHKISATSSKIKGFATYHTIKNYPWVLWKNVPLGLLPVILPRFTLAYWSFLFSALARGQIIPAGKGVTMSLVLLPKKLMQRWRIQRMKSVPNTYLRSILVWDLPPNARRLRLLRDKWWSIINRKTAP